MFPKSESRRINLLAGKAVITSISLLVVFPSVAGVNSPPRPEPQISSRPGITALPIRLRGLDLSRAPTVEELIAAGQLGGPLCPTHELKDKSRDEAARWAFGRAIEQWNLHEYRPAVAQFRQYLHDFPDSPWAAEANLHIGCDATYNGRYTEAEGIFSQLIADHLGKEHPGARMLASKAQQRLALLKVEENNLPQASLLFQGLRQESSDWRQRTYASHWLQRLSRYAAAGRALVNCGAEALGYALEKQGRHADAVQVRTHLPPNLDGHSLASLARLAAQEGLELAAIQVTPSELAVLPLPAILHITPQHSGDKGHYWILDKVQADQVELFDPQSERRFHQSPGELAREWSGRALVFSKGGPLPGRRLKLSEMEEASGGCCGVPRNEDDLGCAGSHGQPGGSQGSCSTCGQMTGRGSPAWSVNMINMNLFVTDTPLWYDPPIGPPVAIELNYNSQSALAQNEPFGNKWQFNYASYLVVDTAGIVLVFMPDGARHVYAPNGTGGYTKPYQVYNTLTRIAPNSFELRFPDDTVYAYQIPSGTSSEQPFLVEIRDPWGQKLSFGYDADVRLATITDAQGLVSSLTYNDSGLIATVTDPFGRNTSFQYDANRNLVRTVDKGGSWTSYTYDSNADLTSIGSERGTWLFRIEAADGIDNDSNPYPPPGGTMYEDYRITITDPLGFPAEYHYNGYSSCSWYVSPRDYVPWRSKYENNFKSNVPKTTYEFAQMHSGRQGEITSIRYPEGGVVEYGYDEETGGQITVSDAHGHTLNSSYNTSGRVASLIDPLQMLTTLSYAANGIDLLSISNGLGRVVATYNDRHQVTSDRDRLTNLTRFAYNSFGQIASEVDALGITNEFVYDGSNHLHQVKRAGLVLSTMLYDEMGRIRAQTDGTGLTVTNDYNALDQITRVTYPDGRSISYAYSPCCPGLLDSRTDRSGRMTRFTYDALKRLTQVTNPDGTAVRYRYDANGNRTAVIDPNGNITTFTYDYDNRLVAKTYPDGKSLTFRYDPAGMLTNRTDARGISTTYIYDESHHLTLTLYSDGTPGVTNVYDDFGRIVQRQDGIGTHNFSHDANSQLTREDGPWANDAVDYSYDPVGQRTNVVVQGAGAVGYAWDALGRLASVSVGGSAYQYSYTSADPRIQQLIRPNGSITSYAYDGLNRLISTSNRRSTGQVINAFNYTYTSQDLISSVTVTNALSVPAAISNLTAYSYNQLSQLTNSFPGQRYAYDDAGNLTKGFTPNNEAFGATYDAENRMRSLSYTNLAGELRRLDYFYDGNGLLAQTKEYRNTAVINDTRYVRNGFLAVQERDSNNNAVRSYAWGQSLSGGIGGLLDLTQAGQHYAYLYDGHGNVTGVLDGTQAAAVSYAYDPFGSVQTKVGTLDQPFRFSTMPYDEATGLARYPYRIYSTLLGRWLSRDVLGEDTGSSQYVFAENNPVQKIDPLGLWVPSMEPPDPNNWQNHVQQWLEPNGVGTIICDGNGNIRPYISPRAPKSSCLQDCIQIHEAAHADDAEHASPGVCNGKLLGTVVLPSSELERASSEVNGYKAERDCLKDKKGCNKKGLSDALKDVDFQYNKSLSEAVQALRDWLKGYGRGAPHGFSGR